MPPALKERDQMSQNMSVSIAGVTLKNPVMVASGTFGSGIEFSRFLDLSRLGAVVTKGVAITPWEGNATPRICETPSGMLNAIGLQNPGAETFIKRDLRFLEQFDTKVIVNVCGHSTEDNISCPNVREGGIAFGTDPKGVERITKEIRKAAVQPVIMKLSPNVTDITEIAAAAEAGGADALSMINTLTGMKIDVRRRTFALANRTGGLSGPAIHPVAVRMVWQCAQRVKIPIIGMGGIASAEDALEMLMAGASAVSVGTANFHDQTTVLQVIDGISAYLDENGIGDVRELIGCVR